ncbi:MAG: hypothetical protein SP1CHLAM54_04170 [Chlamydiia bacterium]|nr:hypothetical protein [Chlamydiia bacterium]MCH9615332.1 hypothetical protein [Chlamydiia bacterium]MCH9628346.1 hypothetical protein [Chlamydiia bacterium]
MRTLFICLVGISSVIFAAEETAVLDPTMRIREPISFEQKDLAQPEFTKRPKSPALAATLSTLVPGLGNFYLGDNKTGSGLMGTFGLEVGVAFGSNNDAIVNADIITLQNTHFYGIYSAYRDARVLKDNSGYRYQMPTESLKDLAKAPFSFTVLKKPEVWGGYLGALALGVTMSYFMTPNQASVPPPLSTGGIFPPLAFPVGIGEEALFRGFIQPALSEPLTPWGGLAASSALFGAMHIPNANSLLPRERVQYYTCGIPFITLLGAYFGYLTQKNTSLKESVAIHAWYDFTLFMVGALASKAAYKTPATFAMTIRF